jgi:methyl-accepting chemotaxis protein
MNKIIKESIESISKMRDNLENLLNEWQEKLDEKENTETQAYENLENKINNLQETIDMIEEISGQLESVEEVY